MWNINAPYPLRDFHKICSVCNPFQDVLAVKISLDLLKGYGVMGVLSGQGLATTLNAEVQKKAKIGVFRQQMVTE